MPTYTSKGKPETSTRERLCPDGNYMVAIVKAEDAISKAGNPMIKLRGEVRESIDGKIQFEDGQGPLIFENLTFTESAAWKIDQFRYAIGEDPEEGEEVTLDADDLLGVLVPCALKQGKNNKGDDTMELEYYITEAGDGDASKGPF